jgi:hypothetical protein
VGSVRESNTSDGFRTKLRCKTVVGFGRGFECLFTPSPAAASSTVH